LVKQTTFFEKFRIEPLLIIIIAIVIIGIGATLLPGTPTNLTPALIAVNLILIIFYYAQWRNTTRPILSVSLIGYDRFVEFNPEKIPEPFILEECHNGAYILLSNISTNLASTIDLEFSITFREIHISEKRFVSYLNPNETAKILVPFNKIIEQYRDQFITVERGSTSYTLPKDTLKIDMVINVTFGSIPRYSMHDTYHIEWVGMNRSPEPLKQIFSTNMRNDLAIYKRKKE
jgi:hypothetical protein